MCEDFCLLRARDEVSLFAVHRAMNTCCGKPSGNEAKGWGIAFGREEGDEYRFISFTWANNYWMFSDDNDKLTWMVNDIVEDLMGLDMEPEHESFW